MNVSIPAPIELEVVPDEAKVSETVVAGVDDDHDDCGLFAMAVASSGQGHDPDDGGASPVGA